MIEYCFCVASRTGIVGQMSQSEAAAAGEIAQQVTHIDRQSLIMLLAFDIEPLLNAFFPARKCDISHFNRLDALFAYAADAEACADAPYYVTNGLHVQE